MAALLVSEIDRLKALVAAEFKIPVSDIVGKSRRQQTVRARQTAMWLVKETTALSVSSIARSFGGKDHTTVMYALKRVRENIERDPQYADTIRLLLHQANIDNTLSDEALAEIDIIADKVRDAVAVRLKEIAERDGRDLARRLVPELFDGGSP